MSFVTAHRECDRPDEPAVPIRVLLVHSDAVLRRYLSDLFTADGYVVDEAADGVQALDVAGERPPDLVVADLDPLAIDSRRLLSGLRSGVQREAVPVIGIADRGDAARSLGALGEAPDDLVYKPLDVNEIRVRVRVFLRRREVAPSPDGGFARDAATGLFDRCAAEGVLEREMQRAQRMRAALSVLLIEVAELDTIKEVYGADVAEDLLCEIVMALRRVVRRCELVGRVADDQFLAALLGCADDTARAVRERVLAGVPRQVMVAGLSWPVKIAVGIAVLADGKGGVARSKRLTLTPETVRLCG